MNSTMKLVLGGIGAYLLYQWYQQNYGQVSTASPQTGASGGASTSSTTAQVTGNTPVEQSPTTLVMMQKWADQNGYGGKLLTAWQWGYIYSQVRGTQAPDPTHVFPGYSATNAKLMSLSEWYAGVKNFGVSGLGDIFQIPAYAFSGGRGPRGHVQSSFRVRGQERASGWERARKVVLN